MASDRGGVRRWELLVLWLVSTVLAGCHSGSSVALKPGDNDVGPPSVAELEARLHAELQRLGKEAADGSIKVAAGAPKGAGGAVFDLTAALIDPDGPPDGQGGGEQPPTGIELRWTERFAGDYDMNGVVGLSDITPIAQKWGLHPSYDSPALHDGFASWPTGNPDDSSGSAAGPGATNWRIARVDGDANGLIALSDVTPIATHCQEALSGYRVYRRGAGDSDFTVLPNPDDASSPLTIPRSKCFPAGQDSPDQSRPVRYCFTDEPPVAGTCEYYVAACLAAAMASSVEADTESNHATVDFDANFPDVTPPTWDTTVGITAATPNADGTVTVEFGTATDVAVPPAPATPPVSYTLYYSTQSPIDYAGAAKAAGATSPWTSPALIAGQTYYFAARAKDSATSPNEEQNAQVLSAVAQGTAVDDHDPPVWTETGADGQLIGGMSEGWTGDQTITIRCAEAEDALSPPVHYDLYYVEDMNVGHLHATQYVFDQHTGELNPGAVVVQDIPQLYELHHRNRHVLSIVVRARDSADPPNETTNRVEHTMAAGRAVRRVIDPWLPRLPKYPVSGGGSGAALGQDRAAGAYRQPPVPGAVDWFACSAGDAVLHKLYSAYLVSTDRSNTVYFVEFDLDTAQWTAQVLPTVPVGEWPSLESRLLAVSANHELWYQYFTDKYHWLHRTESGRWEAWLPGEGRHWPEEPTFDHHYNPAFFSYEQSVKVPGWCSMYYEWWDEGQGKWVRELASDPGGSPDTFLRPDGVLQVVCKGDMPMPGNKLPTTARVLERSPEGVWTTVMDGHGPGGSTGYVIPDYIYPLPTWSGGWGWSAVCNLRGAMELLVATPTAYEFLPLVLDYQGNGAPDIWASKRWPANGGGYHALPSFLLDGGGYFQQFAFGGGDFSKRIPQSALVREACDAFSWGAFYGEQFDPMSGYQADLTVGFDFQGGREELVLLTHMPGDTLFGDAP